jgi:hypothetical protein
MTDVNNMKHRLKVGWRILFLIQINYYSFIILSFFPAKTEDQSQEVTRKELWDFLNEKIQIVSKLQLQSRVNKYIK